MTDGHTPPKATAWGLEGQHTTASGKSSLCQTNGRDDGTFNTFSNSDPSSYFMGNYSLVIIFQNHFTQEQWVHFGPSQQVRWLQVRGFSVPVSHTICIDSSRDFLSIRVFKEDEETHQLFQGLGNRNNLEYGRIRPPRTKRQLTCLALTEPEVLPWMEISLGLDSLQVIFLFLLGFDMGQTSFC